MEQRLTITANKMEVFPSGYEGFQVDLEVRGSEYERILGCYDPNDAIDYFGEERLLDKMDTDKIVSYLRESGYKVEEEEA